ncbi:MAG: hypothetical protein ACK5MI_04460 [Mangrovibacterium sp.]
MKTIVKQGFLLMIIFLVTTMPILAKNKSTGGEATKTFQVD